MISDFAGIGCQAVWTALTVFWPFFQALTVDGATAETCKIAVETGTLLCSHRLHLGLELNEVLSRYFTKCLGSFTNILPYLAALEKWKRITLVQFFRDVPELCANIAPRKDDTGFACPCSAAPAQTLKLFSAHAWQQEPVLGVSCQALQLMTRFPTPPAVLSLLRRLKLTRLKWRWPSGI